MKQCKSDLQGRLVEPQPPTLRANVRPVAPLPAVAPAVQSLNNAPLPPQHVNPALRPPTQHEPQKKQCAQPSGTVRAEDRGTVDIEMVVGVNSQCPSRWVPHPGDTLRLSLSKPPAHGSATIQGTTVLYRPNRDYKGNDSFVILLRWSNRTGHHSGKSNHTVTVN